MNGATKDPCSCANFSDVVIENLKLKWSVHFSMRMITGSAELSCVLLNATDRIVSRNDL
jgi:hypothetical protein